MPLQLISSWSKCQEMIKSVIDAPEPRFIGRMGGSDTDAVADRLAAEIESPASGCDAARRHLRRLRQFNGYYDLDNSDAKYLAFLHLLLKCYSACGEIAFVDAKLLTMYFPTMINAIYQLKTVPYRAGFEQIVNTIARQPREAHAYPYTFYETLSGNLNLFRVFEQSLTGKRVLVISPFETSIHANWGSRRRFLRDYVYPEFEVLTVNTPITYDGLPREFYPHRDWFETVQALLDRVGEIDFDIALLACGSYAMPIGTLIASRMGKKAIYVGGVLQLFFGIIGRRYENPFFLNAINREAFITPVERERFAAHIPVSEEAPKDHFGAYF
jgi:hypothetical protein